MISVTGAAASSSITISFGTCTDTTAGFSCFSLGTGSTPLGRARSFTCSVSFSSMFDRSTSMNCGRSSGRHWMSSSFITCCTTPPPVFTPGAIFGVHEVQRHLHVDLAVLVDALEIHVQHLLPPRVHLVVAQQHLHLLAVHRQVEDRGVERLQLEMAQQRVVVELDVLRVLADPVDDARHAPARRAGGGSHPIPAARAGMQSLRSSFHSPVKSKRQCSDVQC